MRILESLDLCSGQRYTTYSIRDALILAKHNSPVSSCYRVQLCSVPYANGKTSGERGAEWVRVLVSIRGVWLMAHSRFT